MIILISENNVLWCGISDVHLLYRELYILISIIPWKTHLGFMSSTSWFIIEHGYYLLENLHEVGNRSWTHRQVGKFYWEVLSWQTRTLVKKVLLNENFNETISNFGHYFPTWKFQVKKKLFNIKISIVKFWNFWIFPTQTLVGFFRKMKTAIKSFQ